MLTLSKKMKLSLIAISILNVQSVSAAAYTPLDNQLKEHDLKNIIETLNTKEESSNHRLLSLTKEIEFSFGEITEDGYKNAKAIYHNGKITINPNRISDNTDLRSVIIHESVHALHPELTEDEVDSFAANYALQNNTIYNHQYSVDPITGDAFRPSIPNPFQNNLIKGLCRAGAGTALSAAGSFGLIGLGQDVYNSVIGGSALSQELFNAAQGTAVPLAWAFFDYTLQRAQWNHGFPGSHAGDGQRINDALRAMPRVGNILADTLNLGHLTQRTLREELGLLMFVGAIGTNAMIQRVADANNASAAAWPLKVADTAIWGGLNGMVGEFARYADGGTYTSLPTSHPGSLMPYLGGQKWALLSSSINCGLGAYLGNQAYGSYAKWHPVPANATTSEYASSSYGAAAAYMGTWIATDGLFKYFQYATAAGVAGFAEVDWNQVRLDGIERITTAFSNQYAAENIPEDLELGSIPEVSTHMRRRRDTTLNARTARTRRMFDELKITKNEAIAAWERVIQPPLTLNNFQKVDMVRLKQDTAFKKDLNGFNPSVIIGSNPTIGTLKSKELAHITKEVATVSNMISRNDYTDWRQWWNYSSWAHGCIKDGVVEYGQWLSDGGNIDARDCGFATYGNGINQAIRFNDGSVAMGINGRTIKSLENWTIGAVGGTDWSGYNGYAFFDPQGRPTAMAISNTNWAAYGAGFSFIYKNGKWESRSQDNWIGEFSNSNSLDSNAFRFRFPQ
jgi:hypothetical protein